MRRFSRLAIAVVTIAAAGACRGGRPSEPLPASATNGVAAPDAGLEVGGPGTICGLGRMTQDPAREAHECNPGLSCCYPCGIEGCNWVCMADCGPPRP